MELISIREFARRNGVSHVAICKAIKIGRLPSTGRKIDPEVAQPMWDYVKGPRAHVRPEVTATLLGIDPQKTTSEVAGGAGCATEVATAVPTLLDPIQSKEQVTRKPERRSPITVAINGAEFLEVAKWARQMQATIPACVRTKCGLPPWIYRGGEMVGRASQMQGGVMALDRLAVTIMVTETERGRLLAEAHIFGLSLAQFVRTRCGWLVRQTSLLNTEGRYREEDDAWERLQGLGLEPRKFFPQDESQPEP